MRRTYQGRGGAFVRSAEGEQGFWPSYADMMSAVALILFFLMLLSYIQNLITGNDLQNTQEVLADTRAQLELTLTQVDEAKSDLDRVTIDLAEAQLTLDEQKGKLDEQSAQLAAQTKELASQKDELAAQDKLLADQKALLGEQEKYLKAADKELLEMRSRMQTIAVLRLSILEQIRDSVVAVMGDASKVSIGDNGAIVLDEGVLFDFGSSAIKPAAPHRLDRHGRGEPRALHRARQRGAELSARRAEGRAERLRAVLLRRGLRRDAPGRLQRHRRGPRAEPPHRDLDHAARRHDHGHRRELSRARPARERRGAGRGRKAGLNGHGTL